MAGATHCCVPTSASAKGGGDGVHPPCVAASGRDAIRSLLLLDKVIVELLRIILMFCLMLLDNERVPQVLLGFAARGLLLRGTIGATVVTLATAHNY